MQNLAGISGRQVRAWQADGCGLSGRRHDHEDIFPDVNNSSYRYTKYSPEKKFTRKRGRISDILRIAGGSRATRGRGCERALVHLPASHV
jgi:hypothetical protein